MYINNIVLSREDNQHRNISLRPPTGEKEGLPLLLPCGHGRPEGRPHLHLGPYPPIFILQTIFCGSIRT